LRLYVAAAGAVAIGLCGDLCAHAEAAGNSADAPASAAAQPPAPPTRPVTVPLDVRVVVAPTAFNADGKTHLVYELRVINLSGASNCRITGLEVASGNSGTPPLARFGEADLQGMIAQPVRNGTDKALLAAGAAATVYMWVTLDPSEKLPAKLWHRLSVKVGDYPEALPLETGPAAVNSKVVTISPPLRGDHWVAANGPSNTSSHRRALIPVDGQARIAQRFAIDWVRIYEDGVTHHGDPLDNNNYSAYGAEALAVADAVVTEVRDGIPANVPGANSRAVPITLDTVGGNHVVLDIGGGHYALYAHLQTGSLRVKLGDKVHRGQVVGLVGNTGNSTEPHLHFDITDGTSPLGSEGLPYLMTSFELQGHESGGKLTEKLGHYGTVARALVSDGEIVGFSATR